jgi:hypothetical protein
MNRKQREEEFMRECVEAFDAIARREDLYQRARVGDEEAYDELLAMIGERGKGNDQA